jgi:hypothetical protein
LEYAKSLVKAKTEKLSGATPQNPQDTAFAFDDPAEEESWTFVGTDADGADDGFGGAIKAMKSDPLTALDDEFTASIAAGSRGRSLGSKAMRSGGLS